MACASDGGDDGRFPSQTPECLPTSSRVHPKQVALVTRRDLWWAVHEEWLGQCAWLAPTKPFPQREGLSNRVRILDSVGGEILALDLSKAVCQLQCNCPIPGIFEFFTAELWYAIKFMKNRP
jgi:hypothetical protein